VAKKYSKAGELIAEKIFEKGDLTNNSSNDKKGVVIDK